MVILSRSRNLGSVYDKSRSLVFSWFVFTFLSLETFYQSESRARISNSDLGESRFLPFTTPGIGRSSNENF